MRPRRTLLTQWTGDSALNTLEVLVWLQVVICPGPQRVGLSGTLELEQEVSGSTPYTHRHVVSIRMCHILYTLTRTHRHADIHILTYSHSPLSHSPFEGPGQDHQAASSTNLFENTPSTGAVGWRPPLSGKV